MRCGRKICFHGAFTEKKDARRKEKKVHGWIEARNIRGHRRYVVMTEKKHRRKE